MCGSCWAFSTTGSFEAALSIAGQKGVTLSEQELVDCSRDYGNYGCGGGLMGGAFDYIMKDTVGGLSTEDNYPYRARDMSCNDKFKAKSPRYNVASYRAVEPNVRSLSAAL